MNNKHDNFVLLLCHDFQAPFYNVALQYVSLFKNSKYKVVVVFLKGKSSQEVTEGLNAHDVIFLEKKSSELKGFKTAIVKKIKALDARYNFKLCIAHRFKSTYVSLKAGLKTVGISHIDGVYKRVHRRLTAYKYKKQLTLIGVSKAIRDDMRKALKHFPDNQILHLYNSLNFSEIRSDQVERDAARQHLKQEQDSFVFGNVGRLHEDKDQTTLIKAFHKASPSMKGAKLVVLGEGRLRDDLKSLINELKLEDKVALLGNIPEAYKYFKAFDCFVLSSIREGLPVAMLEAFAAKVPPIASECNGNSEAVEGFGVSFKIGDSDKLAELMLKAYKRTPEEITSIQNTIETHLENNFTEEAMRNSFWDLNLIKDS